MVCFAWRWWEFADTYSDVSLTALVLVHILHPYVLLAVIPCGAHAAAPDTRTSLSPLMTLFTNADSIADIR
jgi:hypothetical protein